MPTARISRSPRAGPPGRRRITLLFAALADETRRGLLARLADGKPRSIAHLTRDSSLTRQAITKHLRVLREAGLVRGVQRGREHRFQLSPRPLGDARRALEAIARQWGDALARLKSLVEE